MTRTSKEYAVALFEIAREEGLEDEILDGLSVAGEVFESTPELTAYLRSPGVPKSVRIKSIDDAFSENVPEHVVSFLKLLCSNGEAEIFKDCAAEYKKLYDDEKKVAEVTVTSVAELTPEEKEKLCKKLEKMSGRKLCMEYVIDETLLGGMTVEMDGTVIDGSLKRRLRNIKEVIDG